MNFAHSLQHYFFPSHSNNHKAKILQAPSLLLAVLLIFAFQIALTTIPLTGIKILGYAANIPPDTVISLTNQKRSENGVPPLVYSGQLTQAAKLKGEHMLQLGYWAHTGPDGTEPWKFFTDVGYKYRYAGENLARDFSNPQDAVNAWMSSPSHKENLLSGKYKEIGIAVVEGNLNGVDTTIIVQLFGTQLTDTTPQLAVAQAKPQATAVPSPLPTTSPTLTPTSALVPTQSLVGAQVSPVPTMGNMVSDTSSTQQKASAFQILVSPFESSRSVAVATTSLLLIVLVVDSVIVARRKIPRLSGRTFAHMAFLGMILAILLIAKAGKIL